MIESFKLPTITPETISGAICSFNDEYGNLPLKSCTSLISGYQEGSGTPSPSNVRPLHAFSSATLSACGVNVWNGDYTPNTWIGDTSIGEAVPHTGTSVSDYIPIKPATSYYKFDNGSSRTSYYDKDKNCIGGGVPSGAGVITTPANAYYVRFTITDEKLSGFGINYPSTDTDYHAYNGNTHLFTFGQSIYQGSIDWKRGVVVGTHVFKNWSDLTWVLRSAEVGRWRTVIDDIKQVTSGSVLSSLITDKAETVTANAFNHRINTIYLQAYLNNVELVTGDADNAPSSGQLAYELATPIEIPLGGINLLTQEGQNNIFCDTGDIEVIRLKVT